MHALLQARLLIAQRRYDLAQRELGDCLAADPTSAEALGLLAFVLTEQDQVVAGVRTAREAVACEPQSASLHAILGHALRAAGTLAEAEAAFRDAVRLEPRSPSHRAELSDVLHRRDCLSEALVQADEGLSLDPQHVYCLLARGVALRELGDAAAAREAFALALRLAPEDPHVRLQLGQ
ncbi:MAG TPA: tetratricopeptide repeat protein [Pirellulales bacterium]